MCNMVYQVIGIYMYMKYFFDLQYGIGIFFLVVIMYEVFKFFYYVEVEEVKFFRIGIFGGLGIDQVIIIVLYNKCF